MAKKRKTREQKKLADLRHTFRHNIVEQISSAAKITPQVSDRLKAGQTELGTLISKSYRPNPQAATIQYPYLVKDLSKTGILSLSILLFQIILFALLKNHLLMIPGINY